MWNFFFDPKQQQQYGWNATSSDYRDHISRIERMPSVLNEALHYPNVHKAFRNNYAYGDQKQESSIHEDAAEAQQQKKSPPPVSKAQKKVQVTEHVEIVESHEDNDQQGNCQEVYEDSIDTQADGFITRKRNGFQLCKWKTFKL